MHKIIDKGAWSKREKEVENRRGNVENLKTPTSEQARERGRLGGIASGESRRRTKSIKEMLNLLLDLPVKSEKIITALNKAGITCKQDQVNKMAVALGLIRRARRGETKAVQLLFDLSGEQENMDLGEVEVQVDTIDEQDIERVNKLKAGLFKDED